MDAAPANRQGEVKEHFGFLDGTSNPVLKKSQAGVRYPNHVNLGEVLCGYPNLADKTARYADAPEFIRSLLQDGSFLAVRKLRQDVDALEQALSAAQTDAAAAGLSLTREDFMAKMMGRWPGDHPTKAGHPLAVVPNPGPNSNDFHFETDKVECCARSMPIYGASIRELGIRKQAAGRPALCAGACPTARRASRDSNGGFASESPAQERGLIFMAYNANLGEQYRTGAELAERRQQLGSFSGQADPIFGIAEPGRRRYFRFEQDGKTVRMGLDGSDRLHKEPRPFVRLEWGAYLFAPSKRALASLQARAAAQSHKRTVTWSADIGEKEIARLREFEAHASQEQAIEAWKAALEDPVAAGDFTTASIWAAIRERHGGVLKTPFGVLVAERSLVEQVLQDPSGNLSVKGYLPRMHDSFGEIYLGLDDGPDGAYSWESAACNDAIMNLKLQETFQTAKQSTQDALQALVNEAKEYAERDGDTAWDLTVDARELIDPMLADFCEEWFGLSKDGNFFRRGSYRWDWQPGQPPLYPGHFLAPSRYFFQPRPGISVEDFGKKHGVAARAAMLDFLSGPGAQTKAPVARAVLNSIPGQDLDFAARTIVGAVIGFVPTVNGNLLQNIE